MLVQFTKSKGKVWDKGTVTKLSGLLTVIPAGLEVGRNIFHRDLRLQHMGGAHEKTALGSGNVQIFEDLPPHILRCAEGHDGLGADGTVEGKLIAVGFVDLPEIHALRLYPVRRAMEI